MKQRLGLQHGKAPYGMGREAIKAVWQWRFQAEKWCAMRTLRYVLVSVE